MAGWLDGREVCMSRGKGQVSFSAPISNLPNCVIHQVLFLRSKAGGMPGGGGRRGPRACLAPGVLLSPIFRDR
jgi:hypothetical protein